MEERGEESTEVGVASKHAAKASCCVVAEGNVVEDDREPPGSRLCVCARVFLKRLIVILHMTSNMYRMIIIKYENILWVIFNQMN